MALPAQPKAWVEAIAGPREWRFGRGTRAWLRAWHGKALITGWPCGARRLARQSLPRLAQRRGTRPSLSSVPNAIAGSSV